MNKENKLLELKEFLEKFNVDIDDLDSIYNTDGKYNQNGFKEIDDLEYSYYISTLTVNDKDAIEVATIISIPDGDFVHEHRKTYYFQDHELLFIVSCIDEVNGDPF